MSDERYYGRSHRDLEQQRYQESPKGQHSEQALIMKYGVHIDTIGATESGNVGSKQKDLKVNIPEKKPSDEELYYLLSSK